MKTSITLAVLACILGPLTANADEIEQLTYTSALLLGTSTSLPTGLQNNAPLPVAPFQGMITGSVVFDATQLGQDSVTGAISYSFLLSGAGGTSVGFYSTVPVIIALGCGGGTNCIGLTPTTGRDGAYTGATVDLLGDAYHAPESQVVIGPTGDYATYSLAGTSDYCPSQVDQGNPGGTYSGRTINPCSLKASSSTAGTWVVSSTQAPEIDPGMAGSGMTLLAGCLAILRGRKRVSA
jgi:hypothetical protein